MTQPSRSEPPPWAPHRPVQFMSDDELQRYSFAMLIMDYNRSTDGWVSLIRVYRAIPFLTLISGWVFSQSYGAGLPPILAFDLPLLLGLLTAFLVTVDMFKAHHQRKRMVHDGFLETRMKLHAEMERRAHAALAAALETPGESAH